MTKKTALLEFFQADHDLLIYVVRPDLPEKGIADKAPHILRIPVDRMDIGILVQRIRDDLEQVKNLLLPDFEDQFRDTINYFHSLGQKIFTDELLHLIEPFEGIYIVPFGDWNYLPLHAMEIAPGIALIDRFQISYLPNASMLQFIGNNKFTGTPQSMSGLFVGTDHTGESNLFRNEALQIEALPVFDPITSVSFYNEDAIIQKLFQHAGNKQVIHISSHGYFNKLDALASGALLWNGEDMLGDVSDSILAEEPESFNILSAKVISEHLDINADLVILSGCVTGQNERRSGDELIGLSRALLYAGAQALIVSLFPVLKNVTGHSTDQYCSSRFARFYELWLLENYSKAAAFQKWLCGIKKIPQFAHPYCWFSFVYIGKI